MDFYSRFRTTVHECMRSAMLASAHAAYEVRRIPCIRCACQELKAHFKGVCRSINRMLGSRGMPTTQMSARRARGACR